MSVFNNLNLDEYHSPTGSKLISKKRSKKLLKLHDPSITILMILIIKTITAGYMNSIYTALIVNLQTKVFAVVVFIVLEGMYSTVTFQKTRGITAAAWN